MNSDRRNQSRSPAVPGPIRSLLPFAPGPRQPSAVASLAVLAACGCLLQGLPRPALAAAPRNNLPIPCIGNACLPAGATKPLSFVGSGQILNGAPSLSGDGKTMTVTQLSDKAILNWSGFDVAKGYAVVFAQPGTTSSALNRIWSADPSVVAGAIRANGQILLINQNGIIFANGAQVNTASLVASTLNISDPTYLNGILSKVPTDGSVKLGQVFAADAGSSPGSVTVESGASLAASNGRVILLAPTVENAGTISTPDGQAILGAGRGIYFVKATDSTLRGQLLIQVDTGGTVTNTGTVSAERGNVTLAGMVVNQQGRVSATSSVNARGTIYLVAGEGTGTYQPSNTGLDRLRPNTGGTLKLAPGSVTEIQPDATDTQTVTDAQTYNTDKGNRTDTFARSQVELMGKTVILQGGSKVLAPGGTVKVTAAAAPSVLLNPNAVPYVADGSRIYIDSGATIDVSGLADVAVPVERNLVKIRLGGTELADAPLQRNGFLQGKTVTVDVTRGSTLTDVSAYANNIARGIDEKLTTGGNIRLDSRGDVIARAGSVLDVSGGSVAYQAGYGQTTWLRGADGKIYSIATAPKDIQYVGFADTYTYTLSKWNYSKSWTSPLFTGKTAIPGYRQGAAAGQIDVLAPAMVLEGSMVGKTRPGSQQIAGNAVPLGGRVNIGDIAGKDLNLDLAGPSEDLRAPDLTLANGASALSADFDPETSALPANQRATLSPAMLKQGGISRLGVYSDGKVEVAAPVDVGSGGTVEVVSQAIKVGANIDAAGGSVVLTTRRKLAGTLAADEQSIVVAPDVRISARGGWYNDVLATGQARSEAAVYNGGTVTIKALADVDLGENSVIDVSGGGWLTSAKKLMGGSGGSISVLANNDTGINGTTYGVRLGGDLLGYGLNGGGALNIQSSSVLVGGTATGAPGELAVRPDFFTRGGFSSFSLTGADHLTIAAGAQIRPVMKTLVAGADYVSHATGVDLFSFATVTTLAPELRKPTSVAFKTTSSRVNNPRADAGDLTMEAGSSIVTDAKASVSLTAQENLTVRGSIDAPAGNIALALGADKDNEGYRADQVLLIGKEARLSAAGAAQVLTNNAAGLRQGQVLDGGQISVTANKGYIVTEADSSMDVSGTSAVLDIAGSGGVSRATAVAGAAGSMALRAREGMVLDGDLTGNKAAQGAAGGALTVALDLYNSIFGDGTSPQSPANERNVVLGAGASDKGRENGVVRVDTAKIAKGGFDALEFRSSGFEGQRPGAVTFDGAVNLSAGRNIVIDAPVLAATAGSSASVSAPYLAFGNAGSGNFGNKTSLGALTYQAAGDGTLKTDAQLIDIRGNSAMRGFKAATFASSGDIRLVGSLDAGATGTAAGALNGSLLATGDLNFDSAQVYPTTGTRFTINPTDAGKNPPAVLGAVAFHGNGNAAPVPLSAGGSLTINASGIDQGGVVRAPLGQIAMNAPDGDITLEAGSKTSVSAEGRSIPYGLVQNGQDWLYQYDAAGDAVTVKAPLEKAVTFTGKNIITKAGATTDLSGGGDLYAYEFVVGPGGSKDVLANSAQNGTWAIVPGLGSNYAPLDLQYGLDASVKPGDGIYLSGAPGLPAGFYALLPARYALLPGAFLVSKASGSQDTAPGLATIQRDGSTIVAGYGAVAGTNIRDSRTSGYVLTPATVVRTRSQYVNYSANAFFAAAAAAAGTTAPRLPMDAGRLAFTATGSMAFGGNVLFSHPAGARGGEVDIVAPNISVVDQAGAPDGTTQLLASQLNGFGAESLILGATRDGDKLSVGSSSVVVRNSDANALKGPEIILAATDEVTVKAGSAIEGSGSLASPPTTLSVDGDGALLRVAAGTLLTVLRSNTTGAKGTLAIEQGASLTASGSLTLDATKDSKIAADAAIAAPAVDIAASQMNLGATPAGASGFTLTSAQLTGMKGLTDLSLRSYGSINLYDTVGLGAVDAAGKPSLASLSLDAGDLAGFGSGDKVLQAGKISFTNRNNVAGASGDGTGHLSLAAVATDAAGTGQLALGAGSKTLTGFGGVTLAAGREIQGQGTGALTVAGDLDLQAARVGAAAGSDQQLTATGKVNIARSGTRTDLPAATAGGKLAITGSSVTVAAPVLLPSGQLSLHATGGVSDNVALLAGANLDVSGASKQMPDRSIVYSAGGSITLAADNGAVTAAAGARVDVSGASSADGQTGSDAGTLVVSTPNAAFKPENGFVAKGRAVADARKGSVSIDAGSLENASWLNRLFNRFGFSESRTLRARSGDVTVAAADTVMARQVEISADQGDINVAGSIDARGKDGGSIALWAAKDLNLGSGSRLLASATGATGQGGKVTLGTAKGFVDVRGIIDVGGATADKDGSVLIRAPRTADNLDVQVKSIGSDAIVHARSRVLEGFTTYQTGTLDANASGLTVGDDSSNFAASATALVANPNSDRAGLAGFDVRAGVEIVSTGNLTVAGDINLNSGIWKPSGVPTNLTLRAAGNLNIQGTLSDGFSTAVASTGVLQDVASASYRLTGGADLTAAKPLAVSPSGIGNVVLSPTKTIRTGDGSIDIAAAGDVNLGKVPTSGTQSSADRAKSQQSVVYTAGRPGTVLANFTVPTFNDMTLTNGKRTAFKPTFAKGGGDIAISAGNNVLAAPSDQLISNWLYRSGLVKNGVFGSNGNTAWWVVYPNFQEGVAALGGGNVTVTAGNDIRNFSAFSATTGRLTGAVGTQPVAAKLVVDGGGKLRIDAGRDILSGVFYTGRGDALITAGRNIAAGRTVKDTSGIAGDTDSTPIGTLLGIGEGAVTVRARGNVDIEAAFNPTMLSLATAQSPSSDKTRAFFYTYSDASALNVASTGGDVTLTENLTAVKAAVPAGSSTSPKGVAWGSFSDAQLPAVLPGTVSLLAPEGNVATDAADAKLYLYPAKTGNYTVAAGNNVSLGGTLVMSEVDPAQLLTPTNPSFSLSQAAPVGKPDPITSTSSATLSTDVLHQGDDKPVRIIAGGSISGRFAGGQHYGHLVVPKAASLTAGQDILDVNFSGKNLDSSDVTSFVAGRDIRFSINKNDTNQLVSNDEGIQVGGPGYVQLLAGRNIDLGNGAGVDTRGNLDDARLPGGGATILAAAGLGSNADGSLRAPDTQTFISTYITPSVAPGGNSYGAALTAYMRQLTGNADLGDASALAAFQALPRSRQLPFVAQVLYTELRDTGIAHTASGASYDRGYQAIATLFPNKDYKGDLNMFFSQLKTSQGGDIDTLVPGGSVSVGVTNVPADLVKNKAKDSVPGEAYLGMLALSDGAIRGMASGDIAVNTSRILTLKGGDIMLWSSEGNIDAGKGKRTASAAPPPVVTVNTDGTVKIDASGAISGSGIGQLLTSGGTPGRVDLIAPKGAVDAGDAGIRVAGDLNIAAVVLRGADNISVGGKSTGVSVASTGTAVAGPSGTGDLNKASDDFNRLIAQQPTAAGPSSLFTVDVLGYGDQGEENTHRK